MNLLTAEKKSRIIDKFNSCMAYQCFYEPPNMTFAFVSEGCEILTGYGPQELSLLKFTDIVHPDDVTDVEEKHNATLPVGLSVEVGFRIRTKSGAEKRVLSRSRVAKTDDRGMPNLIEGYFTDITKEIYSRTALSANRENYDFWAKLGYEMRTPMNAILGLAEISLREDLPESVHEYTRVIKKSGVNLLSTLENILDYKNIENVEIIPEEYSVVSFAEDLISTVNEQLCGLEFHVFLDSKIPELLFGDATRIRQVLQRILSNAVKFTQKGFVSFSMEGQISGDTVNLTITVEDTGRGIKEEDLKNLFNAFTQFDTKTIEGTGLGLTVARQLINLMGGDISVASIYGVGSVFTVTLPQKISRGANRLCKVNTPDISVLVLEQDPIYAASITRTLKNLDVECASAASHAEFIDMVQGFTHVFADASHGDFLYGNFKDICPDVFAGLKILNLEKPLYCLPVANALNGTAGVSRKSVSFEAPSARVLVVDDISANFTVTDAFLKPYNMQTDYCQCGAEAIEAVKKARYDLILMDYLMPIMNGSETAELIREIEGASTDCKNVPIIALTVNTDYTVKEIFRKSGANGLLTKPMNEARLNEVIEKWIPLEMRQAAEKAPFNDNADTRTVFSIKGLDVRKGIENSNSSPEVYLQVLKNYHENSRKLAGNLKSCAETADMKNFRIYAHALAGISANIGAADFHIAASRLEKAADRGDLDFVVHNTPKLLDALETLLESIRPIAGNAPPPPETDIGPVIRSANCSPMRPDKKKILLIDDMDSYLFLLDEMLSADYEVIAALDGEQGLEIARDTMPDLILLDLLMPGMSGYEVIEALRADEKLRHIPVIIMSAVEKDDAELRQAIGTTGYVKKPFDPVAIKEKIKLQIGGVENEEHENPH